MSPPGPKRPRGKVRAKTQVPRSPATPSSPTRSPRPSPRRLGGIVIPVIAVLLAIGLGIALGVRSARSKDEAAVPPATTSEVAETTPTTPRTPKQLFADTCGSCHTLADAGAGAGVGPNLDEVRPSRARVLTTIRNGSLSGAMPANLLVGEDAERVATYVSRVAGR